MALSFRHGNPAGGVTLALPVPAAATAGDIIAIGSDGLTALVVTDRATAGTIADFTAAPGLAVGEASVRLIGVDFTIERDVTGTGFELGDSVFTDGEGEYGNTGPIFAGFTLTPGGNKPMIIAVATYPAEPTGS